MITENEAVVVDDEEEIVNPPEIKIKKKSIAYRFIKRTVDIIAGIIGFVILIPMTLIVWLMNKINKEDGPITYEQIRIGKNGKHFRIYKYRTMVVGADEKLKEYLASNPLAKKEWKENRKLEEDPRITKTGKFLRKTSLDELMQILNLLNGTMTLIGPRPVVEDEIEKYDEEERKKFLSVKPGMTGYWQVNGRSNTTYEERKQMELYYVDNCSLLFDLKIFFKTFAVVVKKEGAK